SEDGGVVLLDSGPAAGRVRRPRSENARDGARSAAIGASARLPQLLIHQSPHHPSAGAPVRSQSQQAVQRLLRALWHEYLRLLRLVAHGEGTPDAAGVAAHDLRN